MFSSDLSGLDKMLKDINKLEKQAIKLSKNKAFLKKIAIHLVNTIKDRIQRGTGVDMGGKNKKKKKFKGLKPSTIEERQRLKKQGLLDSRTTPAKSNQINTGTFIDGIHYKIKGNTLEIRPSKDRIDMVKGQMDQGRNGLDLTQEDYIYVLDEIEKELTKIMNKI
jgi:hypothetical protein